MMSKRDYGTSSPALLKEAKQTCRAGISIRKAAVKYKMKRLTLGDHLKHKRGCIGAAKELSANEGKCLAETIDAVGEWGFPLGRLEIKALVQNILNRKGIKLKKFKDNTPGNDWLKNFI